MKKTNKVKMGPLGTPLGNPLGYFNSLKAKAKAEPKQTLRKAQDGLTAGPFDENTSKYLDARYPGTALKFQGPVDPIYEAEQREKVADTHGATTWGSQAALEKRLRNNDESVIRSQGMRDDFNAGPIKTKEDVENAPYYKKGGTHKMPNGKMMLNSAMKKKVLPKAQFGIRVPVRQQGMGDYQASAVIGDTSNTKQKKSGETVTKRIQTSVSPSGITNRTRVKTINNPDGSIKKEKVKVKLRRDLFSKPQPQQKKGGSVKSKKK
jgi:hypothetical protein